MKIAVEGCAHGELDKIYDSLEQLQQENNFKVDLLICCGDFQATRNIQDLQSMAVPLKYQKMCSFYKYYSGEKVAPVLTLFIGGNHEASNHLQELHYGGWAAPNIYYLGYAGVVNIGGVRIAGLSGIYKPHDYLKGRFEKPPYNEKTKRSIFHTRNLEVFRLKQLKDSIDIFISHDWPRGIYKYGNTDQLLKIKPYFSDDIAKDDLGSPACEELLFELKPMYWFSAHLHCKFAALVAHKSGDKGHKKTKFLALDKCMPNRKFLQVLDISHDPKKPIELEYDLEWVTVLHFTNHLINIKPGNNYLPGPGGDERWNFTPTDIEKEFIHKKMMGDMKIPHNFCQTASPHETKSAAQKTKFEPLKPNPQTTTFCEKIGISDPFSLILDSSEQIKKSPIPESPEDNIGSVGDSDLSCLYSSNEEFNTSPWLPDSSNEETPSPKAKGRTNILLPPPKFSSSPLAGDEDIIIIENRLSTSVDNSKVGNAHREDKDNVLESPHIKKFKRRNHSLYKEDKSINEEENIS